MVLRGHGWVDSAQFNAESTQVLTISRDGGARLWTIDIHQPRLAGSRVAAAVPRLQAVTLPATLS